MKLKNFVSKYLVCDDGFREFVIWCSDESNTLYDSDDYFNCMFSDGVLKLFDYMIVDDVCVNGLCIQINCHFQKRKYNKDCKYYQDHADEVPFFDSEEF